MLPGVRVLRRAPAPRPYAEPVDLSQFEGRLLDTLSKYDGLPLERLNNMLAMTPGEPRYVRMGVRCTEHAGTPVCVFVWACVCPHRVW